MSADPINGLVDACFIVGVCLLMVDPVQWLLRRVREPYRLEVYNRDQHWSDVCGFKTFALALQGGSLAQKEERRHRNGVSLRVRHWLSRNFIMADIL